MRVFDALRKLFSGQRERADEQSADVSHSREVNEGVSLTKREESIPQGTSPSFEVTEDRGIPPLRSAVRESLASLDHPTETMPTRPRGDRDRAQVIVGFDFGTHSTKVVFRESSSEAGEVLLMGAPAVVTPIEGGPYPWFGSPSVVSVTDQRVYFGRDAMEADASERIHELKVDLVQGDQDRTFPSALSHLDPKIDDPVEFLTAAYFAWALGAIREHLDGRFRSTHYSLAIQVPAPMRDKGDSELEERYRRCLHIAWGKLRESDQRAVRQGISLTELLHWYRARRQVGFDGDPRALPYQVVPETIAQLAAVAGDPSFGSELYTVFDVGGGTSEITVADVRSTQPRSVQAYADATTNVGHRDLRVAVEPVEKEQILKELAKLHRSVWKAAFDYHKYERVNRKKFFRNHVIRTGGGWYDPDLNSCIASNDPAERYPGDLGQPYHEFKLRTFKPTEESLRIGSGPHHPPSPSRSEFHLLATALGLSIPRRQWPKTYTPEELGAPPEDAPRGSEIDPLHGHN